MLTIVRTIVTSYLAITLYLFGMAFMAQVMGLATNRYANLLLMAAIGGWLWWMRREQIGLYSDGYQKGTVYNRIASGSVLLAMISTMWIPSMIAYTMLGNYGFVGIIVLLFVMVYLCLRNEGENK